MAFGADMKPEGAVSAIEKEKGKSAQTLDQYSNIRIANAEGGQVTLSQAHFDDLHAALQRMQLAVDESNGTIKQYQKDMETMRRVRVAEAFSSSWL